VPAGLAAGEPCRPDQAHAALQVLPDIPSPISSLLPHLNGSGKTARKVHSFVPEQHPFLVCVASPHLAFRLAQRAAKHSFYEILLLNRTCLGVLFSISGGESQNIGKISRFFQNSLAL